MTPIDCPICKGTMYYEDKGVMNPENGFYCSKCNYAELDSVINEDILQWQQKRKIK